MTDLIGGDMLHVRSGDVSGFTEARRRKAREQAVKTGTLTRTAMHLTGVVAAATDEITDEVNSTSKIPSTNCGATVRDLAIKTEILWKPTTTDPNLPAFNDIGSQHTNTSLRRPSVAALRTNDTFESALQSRPGLIPRVDGCRVGVGFGRRVGAPAKGRVVHTNGEVGATYTALPTDAYRTLAENSRKQGIGSNLQVRY